MYDPLNLGHLDSIKQIRDDLLDRFKSLQERVPTGDEAAAEADLDQVIAQLSDDIGTISCRYRQKASLRSTGLHN